MKRKLITLALLWFWAYSAFCTNDARPWTFWYWMYGAVSEEGIKADLKAMKNAGLGGCYLMPIRGTNERPEYKGTAQQLSPAFWRMVDCALEQADSLGLDMGIHICDGFALAGGPWITPEESMQKVVFADTIVSGGQHHFTMKRPVGDGDYYEDIAVYAIPVASPSAPVAAKLTYSKEVTVNAKGVLCADAPCWLQYSFDQPTTVRSIEIVPSGTNFQSQRLLVKASDDGVSFHTVKQLVPPRQGWQNTGFNTTFSIPKTTARYLRFYWDPAGTEPGSEDLDAAKWKAVLRLKDIKLYGYPLINGWEGKAGFVWRQAGTTPMEEIGLNDYLLPKDIVRTQMAENNQLDIRLGNGTWRILRMGHASTGHTNATAGGGKGLECDKFSAETVEKQIDQWFGAFMQRPHHNMIKYMHVDSWECGSQNWSPRFAAEFERRRGYDLLPLLPVYAGVPMQGAEQVLSDIRTTINELINEVFFVTVAKKARQYGVMLSSESVAPTMVSDGIEHYKYVDVPMGEFWLNSPTHDKPNDMLDAISGAHIYGKNIVQAEGFTEVRGVWDETPAQIKPLLDRNFALGMNRLFFHVFTHNPYMDKRPGMTLDGIGLFFQRDQTWYPEVSAFTDYIYRCQKWLQQGKHVADVAVYTGEDVPSRAVLPERLVSMLPGIFGAKRVAAEQQRLANTGNPMEESPVGVNHSASIVDPKDWVNALRGYHYDSMNKDALLHGATFPYRIFVLPEGMTIAKETRHRIDQLKRQGVHIIDKPYHRGDDFSALGVERDAILPDGIAYTHRTTDSTDIYFLANQHNEMRTIHVALRCNRLTPYLYNPMTDAFSAVDFSRNGAYTHVDMALDAHGSAFIIFKHPDSSIQKAAAEQQSMPINAKKWHVAFLENKVEIDTDHLFDWSTSTDERIKFYSGHARYTTTFTLKQKADGRTFLRLNGLHDIARVAVNGRECGIAWTAPYEVDITDAVKRGKNTLDMVVVNTWANALRGADQGKAPYEGIWTNARYRMKGTALLPAGLLTTPDIIIKH